MNTIVHGDLLALRQTSADKSLLSDSKKKKLMNIDSIRLNYGGTSF